MSSEAAPAGPVTFGRYTLLNKLAVGGMAEIFLAQVSGEAGFQRTCVVKRVLAHLAADPAFVKLFLNVSRKEQGRRFLLSISAGF